jgi:hypothetical protein
MISEGAGGGIEPVSTAQSKQSPVKIVPLVQEFKSRHIQGVVIS